MQDKEAKRAGETPFLCQGKPALRKASDARQSRYLYQLYNLVKYFLVSLWKVSTPCPVRARCVKIVHLLCILPLIARGGGGRWLD
jgi:hypothetical protein